ncbi:hypothetical protein L3049_10615 [Labilibaculum sp. DW002]|uniref:Uncharacterized protein n=1 Tax=Paralabilibaculum antarcticum TaxID=2912572 RepID=A0ABT5VSQ5_9BACT|nr:hypothetical protein [Labilibaculum sp. DW002]MDE5418461.1 hypothetical protein [Labilibaculum sp. DW002]
MVKNNKHQNIYNSFKNHKKTEGYELKGIYEIFYPFWQCKQSIVVEKDAELDKLSKILLELIKAGINSHSEICSFLGINEDDFVTMQFHYLIKNELITENNSSYKIELKGLEFLKKKRKIQNTETVEFEYFYDDLSMELLDIIDYKYLYNDLSKEYFNPDTPIDKNISKNKKKHFSGYQVIQTNKLKKNNNKSLPKNHLQYKNRPILSKIKQSDFAEFFNRQKKNMTFYDYDNTTIKTYERSIQFLLLEFINDENQIDIELRQFKSSVREFNGYVLEDKLSKETNKYIKKNEDFIKELRSSFDNRVNNFKVNS